MLRERIVSRLKEMSAGQIKVARFILDRPNEAAFLTATEMGKKIGVSESTVIRLASALGFTGYPKLRKAIQGLLMTQMSTLERMLTYDQEERRRSPFERAIERDVQDLSSALALMETEKIHMLGNAIAAASAVYITAHRSSLALAWYFHFYLSWFLHHVEILQNDLQLERLINAPRNSLVIGISFPRYSSDTVAIMKQVAEMKIDRAVITDDYTSPLASSTPQHLITVPCSHLSFIDSFSAPISMINCILLSVTQARGDAVKGQLEALERIWKDREIYTA